MVPDCRKWGVVGSVPVATPATSAVCPRGFLPALACSAPACSCGRGPSGHKCLAGVSPRKGPCEDTRSTVPGEGIGLGLRSQTPWTPELGMRGGCEPGWFREGREAGSGRWRRGGCGSTEPCLRQEAPGRERSLLGQGLEDRLMGCVAHSWGQEAAARATLGCRKGGQTARSRHKASFRSA